MKKLIFLLAGVFCLAAANAHPSTAEARYQPCASAFCKCTNTLCNCVEKLEYAFMDEPNSYDTYVFFVRLCHDGPEICGVAPKPIVKLNAGQYNEKDVSDEVLISWSVGLDSDFNGGQVNYTVTYKIDGQVKTKTGSFSYL